MNQAKQEFNNKPKDPFNIKKIILLIGFFIVGLTLFILSFNVLKTTTKDDEIFVYDTNKYILCFTNLFMVLVIGYKFLYKGIKNLFHLDFDEVTLMTLSIISAFIINEYYEALMVLILFSIGEMIEDYASYKTNSSIESLFKIRPEKCNLLVNNKIVESMAVNVPVGSQILIKPGDKIPIDSIIIQGKSTIDTSPLTGESMPRSVYEGIEILSGTINLSGKLICKTLKNFEDSTASKMISLIQNSINLKSKRETTIKKFTKIYTPIVILISILVITIPLAIKTSWWIQWFDAGLAVLLSACPCAFVISIPLAYFCGVGLASKNNILIKGTKYIDEVAKVNCVCFDKTGTLTNGKFSINDIQSFNGLSKQEILKIAGSLEKNSNHPIAFAISESTKSHYAVTNFKEIPGYGVIGKIKNKRVMCGNYKLLKKFNIKANKANISGAFVYVVINKKLEGLITLSDTIRFNALDTINQLKNYGVNKYVMLSGDNPLIVKSVAEQLGINEYYGNLLPLDKINYLKQLISKDYHIAYIGDGINDAASIKMSNVGVSMALGTDLAKNLSDVVLMNNDLSSLTKLFRISHKTLNIVKFNLWFIIAIKFISIFIVIMVNALMPNPIPLVWLGVLIDVGLTIFSVLNSFRILKYNIK